jgi:hypothetical protein
MTTSDTQTEVTKPSESSLGQDLLRLLRFWLRDRRVLIAIAVVAVVGGGVLNWGWLVAIGVAPIILAIAPCAAMCAVGLCSMNMMGKKGGASCHKEAVTEEKGNSSTHPMTAPDDQRGRTAE